MAAKPQFAAEEKDGAFQRQQDAYYVTHTEINPTGIVHLGPLLDLNPPHGREKLA